MQKNSASSLKNRRDVSLERVRLQLRVGVVVQVLEPRDRARRALTACQGGRGHLLTFVTFRVAKEAAFLMDLAHNATDQDKRAMVMPAL
jgi:hypothetical protein